MGSNVPGPVAHYSYVTKIKVSPDNDCWRTTEPDGGFNGDPGSSWPGSEPSAAEPRSIAKNPVSKGRLQRLTQQLSKPFTTVHPGLKTRVKLSTISRLLKGQPQSKPEPCRKDYSEQDEDEEYNSDSSFDDVQEDYENVQQLEAANPLNGDDDMDSDYEEPRNTEPVPAHSAPRGGVHKTESFKDRRNVPPVPFGDHGRRPVPTPCPKVATQSTPAVPPPPKLPDRRPLGVRPLPPDPPSVPPATPLRYEDNQEGDEFYEEPTAPQHDRAPPPPPQPSRGSPARALVPPPAAVEEEDVYEAMDEPQATPPPVHRNKAVTAPHVGRGPVPVPPPGPPGPPTSLGEETYEDPNVAGDEFYEEPKELNVPPPRTPARAAAMTPKAPNVNGGTPMRKVPAPLPQPQEEETYEDPNLVPEEEYEEPKEISAPPPRQPINAAAKTGKPGGSTPIRQRQQVPVAQPADTEEFYEEPMHEPLPEENYEEPNPPPAPRGPLRMPATPVPPTPVPPGRNAKPEPALPARRPVNPLPPTPQERNIPHPPPLPAGKHGVNPSGIQDVYIDCQEEEGEEYSEIPEDTKNNLSNSMNAKRNVPVNKMPDNNEQEFYEELNDEPVRQTSKPAATTRGPALPPGRKTNQPTEKPRQQTGKNIAGADVNTVAIRDRMNKLRPVARDAFDNHTADSKANNVGNGHHPSARMETSVNAMRAMFESKQSGCPVPTPSPGPNRNPAPRSEAVKPPSNAAHNLHNSRPERTPSSGSDSGSGVVGRAAIPPPQKASSSERPKPRTPAVVQNIPSNSPINSRPSSDVSNNSDSGSGEVNKKPARSGPLPPIPTAEEDLDSYNWFFGDANRASCERLLTGLKKDGAFLVRVSRKGGSNEPYTLHVFSKAKVWNLHIRKRNDNLFALGSPKPDEKTFPTLGGLIKHHKTNMIMLTSQGNRTDQVCLSTSPNKL